MKIGYTPQLHRVRRSCRVTPLSQGAGLTDEQLLTCYVVQRDPDAFQALVRRHGPMVFGVCLRRLPSAGLAEIALQATFLALAQNARSVRPRAMLARWLYHAACTTALVAANGQRQPGPSLDAEVCRLPKKYRIPFILCQLAKKTVKEAARELDWTQDVLVERLSKAKRMLGHRLIRSTEPLTRQALAASLDEMTAPAVPTESLCSATAQAAASRVSKATPVSPTVASLTRRTLRRMLLQKVTLGARLVFSIGLISIGLAELLYVLFATNAGG
jgi:RNA polymerase sigma-70 factor (ECF subfamily)